MKEPGRAGRPRTRAGTIAADLGGGAVASLLLLLAAGCALAGPRSASRPRPSACRPADALGNRTIARVGALMRTDNPGFADWRARAQLPLVAPGELALEADARVCRRLARAYAAKASGAGAGLSGRVYAVRVGPTRYVVLDPIYRSTPASTQLVHMVFDARYAWLSSFGD